MVSYEHDAGYGGYAARVGSSTEQRRPTVIPMHPPSQLSICDQQPNYHLPDYWPPGCHRPNYPQSDCHRRDLQASYQQFEIKPISASSRVINPNIVESNYTEQMQLYNYPKSTTCPSKPEFKKNNKNMRKKQSDNQPEDLVAKLDEIKLDDEKHPVAKLYEIIALKKLPIDISLVSIAGHVHNQQFTYCVKSDNLVVYGCGKSKKEAKRIAAVKFLNSLECKNGNNVITSTISNSPVSSVSHETPGNIFETKWALNPIGALQELCMVRRWQLPEYRTLDDCEGEGNSHWYIISCSISTYRTSGQGNTKQSAKRESARQMYRLIKDLSEEEISNHCHNENQLPNVTPILNREHSDGQNLSNNVSSNILKQSEKFFNQLKTSTKPSLNTLKQVNTIKDLKTTSVNMLKEIGKEEGFTSSYVMISDKSEQDRVVVQLTINPIMLYVGSGSTLQSAQEAAAFAALVYMKLMLQE